MNRQLYDKLVDIINSNKLNLTRKELYDYIINKDKDDCCFNKIIIKYDTFASIYGNIKRRQIFKSSNSNFNWKKLKENSISLKNKYMPIYQQCSFICQELTDCKKYQRKK